MAVIIEVRIKDMNLSFTTVERYSSYHSSILTHIHLKICTLVVRRYLTRKKSPTYNYYTNVTSENDMPA